MTPTAAWEQGSANESTANALLGRAKALCPQLGWCRGEHLTNTIFLCLNPSFCLAEGQQQARKHSIYAAIKRSQSSTFQSKKKTHLLIRLLG